VAWRIEYYEQHGGSVPAAKFLDGCPAQFDAVFDAVAAAPPPRFSGGGKWEAMHGSMGGYYEIRLTGPGREQIPPVLPTRERRADRVAPPRTESAEHRRHQRHAQGAPHDLHRPGLPKARQSARRGPPGQCPPTARPVDGYLVFPPTDAPFPPRWRPEQGPLTGVARSKFQNKLERYWNNGGAPRPASPTKKPRCRGAFSS
jgi:hypothetical protein